MLKFGGHPMAAGLSLLEENIDEFRRELNERSGLTEEDFKAKLWIDVPMPIDYINERLVEELKILEPFGQGNEKCLWMEFFLQTESLLRKNGQAELSWILFIIRRSMSTMETEISRL